MICSIQLTKFVKPVSLDVLACPISRTKESRTSQRISNYSIGSSKALGSATGRLMNMLRPLLNHESFGAVHTSAGDSSENSLPVRMLRGSANPPTRDYQKKVKS